MERIIELIVIIIALAIYFPVAIYFVFKKPKTKEGGDYEKRKKK